MAFAEQGSGTEPFLLLVLYKLCICLPEIPKLFIKRWEELFLLLWGMIKRNIVFIWHITGFTNTHRRTCPHMHRSYHQVLNYFITFLKQRSLKVSQKSRWQLSKDESSLLLSFELQCSSRLNIAFKMKPMRAKERTSVE